MSPGLLAGPSAVALDARTVSRTALARYLVSMTVDQPRVIREPIAIGEVKDIAQLSFGDMAKASSTSTGV
ncbi:hypothetical protein BH11GEM1_BH11GEM1_02830 [soil metagenome]